jgi:sulfatase modifying factor 1
MKKIASVIFIGSIFIGCSAASVCAISKDNLSNDSGFNPKTISEDSKKIETAQLDKEISAKTIDLKKEEVVSSSCPTGMVDIEGDYCPVVEQECLKWLDKDTSASANDGIGPMRCAEFKSPARCLSSARVHMHFCMARFEYPGTEGSYPLVGMTYPQAKEIAKNDGNRLCTSDEFNFACEGEEMHPYGYGDGFHRDANIANIDKPWIDYTKFSPSIWNDINGGLYQAIKSDGKSQAKSWAGVYNLNGNVDEIMDSEQHKNAVLGGGYWGPVRTRCRPRTLSHNKTTYSFYQLGFRECSDIRH